MFLYPPCIFHEAPTDLKCFWNGAFFLRHFPARQPCHWSLAIFHTSVPCGENAPSSPLHAPYDWDMPNVRLKQYFTRVAWRASFMSETMFISPHPWHVACLYWIHVIFIVSLTCFRGVALFPLYFILRSLQHSAFLTSPLGIFYYVFGNLV